MPNMSNTPYIAALAYLLLLLLVLGAAVAALKGIGLAIRGRRHHQDLGRTGR